MVSSFMSLTSSFIVTIWFSCIHLYDERRDLVRTVSPSLQTGDLFGYALTPQAGSKLCGRVHALRP
jgi:hypothetical protein